MERQFDTPAQEPGNEIFIRPRPRCAASPALVRVPLFNPYSSKKAQLAGALHGLSAVIDAYFRIDVVSMALDRVERKVQLQ